MDPFTIHLSAERPVDTDIIVLSSSGRIPAGSFVIIDSAVAVADLPADCVLVTSLEHAVRLSSTGGRIPAVCDSALAAQHINSPQLLSVFTDQPVLIGDTVVPKGLHRLHPLNATAAGIGSTLHYELTALGVDVVPIAGDGTLNDRMDAVGELLWALGGSRGPTPTWATATTRRALDRRDLLCNRPGECGPVYGHQWRKWGSMWASDPTKISRGGTDQLRAVIESVSLEISTGVSIGPHVVCAWAADDIDEMALVPTHFAFQLIWRHYALHMVVSIARITMWTEFPLVLTMYSVLTHMLARIVGVRAGRITFNIADPIQEACSQRPRRSVPVTIPTRSLDQYVGMDPAQIMFAW